MASFQAKIGWKMLRKRENKIIVPFRSYPTRNRNFQKNSREIVKIKIIIPFRSYPTRNKKFQKNSRKMKKIKKIPLWLHFKP